MNKALQKALKSWKDLSPSERAYIVKELQETGSQASEEDIVNAQSAFGDIVLRLLKTFLRVFVKRLFN